MCIRDSLYPVDQVKINNSAGAEAVAVAPEDEIKVLLPNDYDPDKMVTDIQLNSESVDAPVREGDVDVYKRQILLRSLCSSTTGTWSSSL